MNTFYKLLGVTLLVATVNNFVWFALTYWAYLETKSVVSTSTIGGIFLVANAISSFWFGSIIDHNKKKHAMIGSSIVTLILFVLGYLIYALNPPEVFTSITSPLLWVFVLVLLSGVMVGSIYNIALPTLVALIVPEDSRDKANGLLGTVMGVAFGITSVASGLTLAFGGMFWVLVMSVVGTVLALVLLAFISVPEKEILHMSTVSPDAPTSGGVDIKGTVSVIKGIPGLFPLIFFTMFNNFLGGVFMALMDAYGLSLVSVQTWGLMWGALSSAFIIGGMYIAKKGLGNNPLKNLFRINIVMWTICIFFTIQPSIILLGIGMFLWMCLMPFIEATEQTIFQKVVPQDRLGRVFGFAHSVEQAASPLTAFIIGPIAQFLFIPFMTTGAGVRLIGNWFGVGPGRGIALVFIAAGFVGLIVTLFAMRSRSYRVLAEKYAE